MVFSMSIKDLVWIVELPVTQSILPLWYIVTVQIIMSFSV